VTLTAERSVWRGRATSTTPAASANATAYVTAMRFTTVIAKFHYTDPTGPARTQRSFAAKKVRAGPWGSGRVRVGSVSV